MSIVVSVAPNGGWLSKLDHPRLPLSIAELAAEARACSVAGARLMHFHVRGAHGEHSIDAGLYREALREIEPQAGGMILQISTESRGVGKAHVSKAHVGKAHVSKAHVSKASSSSSDDALYSPQEQAQCIFASNCRAASVSFSEICAGGAGGAGAGKNFAFARSFYAEAAERGIHLQHILYSAREAASFQRALAAGIVVRARGHKLCVLFVFGKGVSKDTSYGEADSASFTTFIASCLQPFSAESFSDESLSALSLEDASPPLRDESLWFACAFGKQEQAMLIQASLLPCPRSGLITEINTGVRLGFENNLYAPDGELADTNAAQILSFVRAAEAQGLTLASQEQTNAELGLA